ncbi:hypothetical protein PsorP6_004798 [Peronosclerospora sorghi]|uniref:Uncharacterized protein n=1 Tax=Peronosclerospora sorghi TaxID=230839 RepID=A0ACC0VJ50_9STRA|nr:hypothetical protein PsorP6_004798 [Peronosclerospora sorghi]
MIMRLAILLLVVLVSMTTVRADDPPATPAVEDASKEQTPPGVVLLADKEPVPSNKEQLELIVGGGSGFIPTAGITYRYRYTYPYAGGFRYGWRYPVGYWNSFGHSSMARAVYSVVHMADGITAKGFHFLLV